MRERFVKNMNSITLKSIGLLIVITVGILICMEIGSYYFISRYEKNTEINYQQSLDLYMRYWDNTFESMNNELLSLVSMTNSERLYWNACKSDDELVYHTSLSSLVRRFTEIAWNHGNEILVFAYIPDRDVYIKSGNAIAVGDEKRQLDQSIMEYIDASLQENSEKWRYCSLGNDRQGYFLQVYHLYNGYVGCAVREETVFRDIRSGSSQIQDIRLSNGSELLNKESRISDPDDANSLSFDVSMRNLSCDISVFIEKHSLFGDKRNFTLVSAATVFIGILLMILNIRFQMHYLLTPLHRLKEAMEQFSRGDFEVRLHENRTSNEISILFETFNNMASHIVRLTKEVYEKELAAERMRSNYLRVQIQPHFYTNILNLIYGLAQIRDCDLIQKLSMTTGKYFRYLLAEKGSFVKLKEEMECIRNYCEIQKIRYGESLSYSVSADPSMDDELVLPLILQTFVGNSVKHNINVIPMLKIEVAVRKAHERIQMSVTDNGAGFFAKTLDMINHDEDISENGEHIGIMNVKQRLRLLYGDKGDIQISSVPGHTCVTVSLPVII